MKTYVKVCYFVTDHFFQLLLRTLQRFEKW
jgi:hypothetical protein